MKLSDEEVAHIRRYIDASGLTLQTLKDDLLDHLICLVEMEKSNGRNFEAVLQDALNELAPHGLRHIERETIFLLNPLKIIRMKKVMYSIGLLSAASISLGWLFLILHWPGGTELFNYGFIVLLLVFMPMLAIDRYKVNIRQALSEKLRLILGLLSALVIGSAITMKILHLQGADQLLIAGCLMFTFGFLPFLFFTLYKRSVTRESD